MNNPASMTNKEVIQEAHTVVGLHPSANPEAYRRAIFELAVRLAAADATIAEMRSNTTPNLPRGVTC